MGNSNNCLAAALTLLIREGLFTKEEVTVAIARGDHALFDLLNDCYKEQDKSDNE